MNYLITGGAGFIGLHLARMLAKRGHKVGILDNFLSSRPFFEIQDEFIKNDVLVLDGDVRRHIDVDRSCAGIGAVDGIFHLACVASPKIYLKDPIGTLDTCYIGTKNVLEIAEERGIPKVVFSSTSEIYGDPLIATQHEAYFGNVDCTSLRSCYDEGKRAAETLCAIYASQGLDIRVARIFNTYGPGMSLTDGRVVVEFIKNAIQGLPLEIHGTGEQTRCLMYITDCVLGLIDLMLIDRKLNGTALTLNIGDPRHPMTVRDLAIRIRSMCESHSLIGSRDQHPYPSDPQMRQPNIDRAGSVLGWKPKAQLASGLYATILDIKDRLHGNSHSGDRDLP